MRFTRINARYVARYTSFVAMLAARLSYVQGPAVPGCLAPVPLIWIRSSCVTPVSASYVAPPSRKNTSNQRYRPRPPVSSFQSEVAF